MFPSLKVLSIGFSGSQQGMSPRQLRAFGQIILCHLMVEYLPVEFHHGDDDGADAIAHDFAKALWFRVFIHPPDNDYHRAYCKTKPEYMRPEKPFLDRNKDIVNETNVLVAAPSGEERLRSGTWATVRYARKLGRPIFMAWPDGRLTMEGRWPNG